MATTDQSGNPALPVPYDDLTWGLEWTSRADGTRILGTLCRSCDCRMAGRRYACSQCMSRDLEEHWFGPRGVLYSFTTVHASPKAQSPYTLGYVDLDGGIRVLALVDGPVDVLRCDMPVEVIQDGEDWSVQPTSEAALKETLK